MANTLMQKPARSKSQCDVHRLVKNYNRIIILMIHQCLLGKSGRQQLVSELFSCLQTSEGNQNEIIS